MTESVGLSIGATNLAAVTVGRAAVTRPAVLTREPGLVFTDFVDRVGDPVGLVAPDGTTHRPEALLVEALRPLHGAVPPGAHIGIGHPAHWHPHQVAALHTALAADQQLRSAPIFSDAVTALAALSDNPGLPARGVVALCDFGGTGTSVTVADAANGYQPIAPSVRYAELSGALIDQALLTHVLAGVPGAADGAGTSAIGSLSRLRAECRTAKERLSGAAAAAVPVDLPGHRTEVRITREELDAVLREPLGDFLAALRDMLQRSGIRAADLAAVASVGGGARIPAVTAALSEQFRVPVVTLPQPELAAAIGAGIRAARPAVEEGATTVAPVAPIAAAVPAPDPAMSSTFRALAWSQDTDEVPGAEPFVVDHPIDSDPSHSFTGLDARPQVRFADHEEPEPEPVPWYRRPALLIGTGAAVVLAACVAAAVFVMRTDQAQTPTSQTTTPMATANPATPSAAPQQPSPAEAPAPATEAPPQTRTVTRQAPVTQAPPPPATEAPAPTSEAPPPPTPEPPLSPEPTTEAPTTPPPLIPTIPPIPPIPTIPGLPAFIPQPGQQLPH